MRAILQPAYGSADILHVAEVERPTVHAEGVLVEVVAASLHKGDWHVLTGTPYPLRLAGFGLLRPTQPIPGMAIAGRVVAVGARVQDFAAGDEVFGEIGRGGFAEFVCPRASELARMPAGISFEDAATIAVSGTTALQGLRDAGKLQAGQSVLINGAAGGVGTFAVQIAKALGATVTAVCGEGSVERMKTLGADQVVDYTKEDFTRSDDRYDVMLDLVGNRPLAACRAVLTERGRFVAAAGGADNRWIGPMFVILKGMASNLFSRQPFVPLVATPRRADLLTVAEMVVSGRVRPVIDRRVPLGGVAQALADLGKGHSHGKVVVTP